jgi:hypothetical protein
MSLRNSMCTSVTPYLHPGEPVQAVIGAQTSSQFFAVLTGIFAFLGLNRYRIIAVTPARILVLDAGKFSMKTARAIVMELPRHTCLGPGNGLWHKIPAGGETLRVHRRFFKDIDFADASMSAA